MEQYISKTAIVAEINSMLKSVEHTSHCDEASFNSGRWKALTSIKKFLDTFELKEADLDYIKDELDRVVKIYKPNGDFGWGTLYNIATHFFELGLKAKQESNDEVKIGETQIYLEDDGGEPPYEGKQWLDLSCMEHEIPKTLFKEGDNVEIFIRKAQKGE